MLQVLVSIIFPFWRTVSIRRRVLMSLQSSRLSPETRRLRFRSQEKPMIRKPRWSMQRIMVLKPLLLSM